MRRTLLIFALTLAGFALRLQYLTTSHPFFDEYTTALAARQILDYGWPVLPSGLFYEHGLLATYLTAPFMALFASMPPDTWQPAHWGLMLARWPSLLVSTFTIPLIYALGKRALNLPTGPKLLPYIGLLAAGLFAFSPAGMVWGGRARMYALATLLVFLTVYWAYRGAFYPAPAKYRWVALLALLAALLTQFGALTLVPPLVIGMLVIGWLSRRSPDRPWFLRATVLPEMLALGAVVGGAILVKRLGQPLGTAPLGSGGGQSLLEKLIYTITYQTTFHFTWTDTISLLARQFGVPHHYWLSILTLAGAGIGVVFWLTNRQRKKIKIAYFPLFLWLVFGLIILEMVTLLDPFRRNPRYLVMYLPLFYLIAARAVFNFRQPLRLIWQKWRLRNTEHAIPTSELPSIATLILIILFTLISFNDLRIAFITPEPAYEEAFAFIHANHRPGDAVLTMNTPAAGFYLDRVDGFTAQNEAKQFLLNADTNPVDRWLGVPWIGTASDFSAALNSHPRAWFVIDTIRLPVYFRGSWLAVVNRQMEQVWANDNALVYLTRPDRTPLPAHPEVALETQLGDTIRLTGYALHISDQTLDVSLFWEPLVSPAFDYTVFLHLRDQNGTTVAQRDTQPLDGIYPTSAWQPGEQVIDLVSLPLPADVPPGTYILYAGMYRLDTLERLPVTNDKSGENAVILGEVVLP